MRTVRIDCERIRDEATLHDVFAEAFNFPGYYGRNWNAWIDCMGDLGDGVTAVELKNVTGFAVSCPELYAALVECAAFVNWRSTSADGPPILALSYYLQT